MKLSPSKSYIWKAKCNFCILSPESSNPFYSIYVVEGTLKTSPYCFFSTLSKRLKMRCVLRSIAQKDFEMSQIHPNDLQTIQKNFISFEHFFLFLVSQIIIELLTNSGYSIFSNWSLNFRTFSFHCALGWKTLFLFIIGFFFMPQHRPTRSLISKF